MRVFVSVVPPPPALAALTDAVAAVRADFPALGWVAPERWHVTLAFLGDVTEPVVERLDRLLAGVAAERAPVGMRIAGAGAFPRAERARVVWAGVDGDERALTQLARAVRRAAREVRIPVDRTPFRAHVTLARGRSRWFDATPIVDRLGGVDGPGWTAGRFVLVRSHLGPKPRYEDLAGYDLAG